MGNAVEAMPGGVEVRIKAEMRDGAALVHVEDNGPGIGAQFRSDRHHGRIGDTRARSSGG